MFVKFLNNQFDVLKVQTNQSIIHSLGFTDNLVVAGDDSGCLSVLNLKEYTN